MNNLSKFVKAIDIGKFGIAKQFLTKTMTEKAMKRAEKIHKELR